MAIKISQSLKQTQTLTMTPQLQQAIKLLTLTHLEMTNVIASEMVENPMLEEMGGETGPSDEKGEVDYKVEKLEMQNKEATADSIDGDKIVKGDDEFDWNNYIESYNPTSSSPPNMATRDTEESMNYENMVSEGQSLADHLIWQLRMESLSDDEWELAESIIHNINDDGYLDVSFDELVSESSLSEDHARDLLEKIKRLDPVGCGSSSLVECLLVQLNALEGSLPIIEEIIQNHLESLQSKSYKVICRELDIEEHVVKNAELVIMELNPKPGRLISPEATQYVVPDIYIYEVGGELKVQLNDEGVPRLRISKLYQSMLQSAKSLAKDEEAKDYVQDKLRSAMWLIKSIQNRQKTIMKVAEAIVKYQPLFFKKGAQYLKPMILKDIANEIGMHESTVSRVTTNKFLHSPLGTFELKYFFNTGIGGKNGGVDIASESLKIKIKKMIENENKKKPLSDQKIVELLAMDDVKVARRTVAKYRESLNIASSSKRKQRD